MRKKISTIFTGVGALFLTPLSCLALLIFAALGSLTFINIAKAISPILILSLFKEVVIIGDELQIRTLTFFIHKYKRPTISNLSGFLYIYFMEVDGKAVIFIPSYRKYLLRAMFNAEYLGITDRLYADFKKAGFIINKE